MAVVRSNGLNTLVDWVEILESMWLYAVFLKTALLFFGSLFIGRPAHKHLMIIHEPNINAFNII